jgi:pimeloyl-ACP methyl ester carboxylesterase
MSSNFTAEWIRDNEQAFNLLVLDAMPRRRPMSAIAAHAAAIAAFNVTETIRALTLPTMVLHGDNDRIISVGCGVRLAAALPNRYDMYGTCSHPTYTRAHTHSTW